MDVNIYFAGTDDSDVANTIASKLKDDIGEDTPMVVLSRGLYDNSLTVRQYLLRLFRQHGLHRNQRELLLTEEDQLVTVQLCLAELNKQATGDYDVEMSKVLELERKVVDVRLRLRQADPSDNELNQLISAYETFLMSNNLMDSADVHQRLVTEMDQNQLLQDTIANTCYLLLHKPADRVEEVMVKLLAASKPVVKVCAELPLNDSLCVTQLNMMPASLEDFLPTVSHAQMHCFTPATPCLAASSAKQLSVSEVYVERIFVSYLHLLVNSRSELALARVINTPNRDLSHRALNDIKRHAKNTKMPMYQSMVSYLMRLRLGGKSYAPDPNSPLASHVKGLGEFTDLMNKLQTLVEEDSNTESAVRRVINVLKKVIVKCKDAVIRRDSVETVASRLQLQADGLIGKQETTHTKSPQEPGRGGSQVGRHTIRVLRRILDHHSSQPTHISVANSLSDAFSSQSTPVRFPCLLSQFRSPLEASPGSKESQSLTDRIKKKKVPTATLR